MMYLLLVTWIYPNQPPAAYQVEFESEATCMAARQAVYRQAEELRQHEMKFAKAQAQVSGVSERLIAASVQLPNATAACVKR